MAERIVGGRKFRRVIDGGDSGGVVIESTGPGNDDFAVIAGEYATDGADIGESDSNVSGSRTIDPASIPDSGDAGTGKRKRGRPRGSTNGNRAAGNPTQRATATKATDSIEALLFTVHTFGAMLTKTPELMLSEDEAKELAKAVTRVTQLYDLPLMDEKTLAWMGLFMVAGKVYGPRMVAVAVNTKKAKVAKGPTIVQPKQAAQHAPIPDFMHAAAGVQ